MLKFHGNVVKDVKAVGKLNGEYYMDVTIRIPSSQVMKEKLLDTIQNNNIPYIEAYKNFYTPENIAEFEHNDEDWI